MKQRLVVALCALVLAVFGIHSGEAAQAGGQSLASLSSYRFRLNVRIEREEQGQPTQIAELVNTGEIIAPNRFHGDCLFAIGPFELREEVIAIGNDSFVRGPDTGGRFIEETPDLCDSSFSPGGVLEEAPLDTLALATLRNLDGTPEQRNGVAAQRYDLSEAVARERLLELARTLYGVVGPENPPRELTTNSAYIFTAWLAEDGRWPVALALDLSFPVEQRTFTLRFSLDITDPNSPAIVITDPTAVALPATLTAIDAGNASRLGLVRSLRGHAETVNAVVISRDGSTIASASEDGVIRVWDAVSGETRRTMRHGSAVNTIALAPDGRLLAAGDDDGAVRLWDITTGEQVRTLTGHLDWVWTVAFSPDGTMLASGSEDNTVKLWDVESGMQLRTMRNPDAVNGVAFTPDGRFVVGGGDDNVARMWDTATGEVARAFTGHQRPVWGIAFSPDGSTMASTSLDGTVKLWNTADASEVRTLRGHDDGVLSISWSGDGALIVSADIGGATLVWDAASGRQLTTLRSARSLVRAVTISADQKLILTVGRDRAVRMWAVLPEAPPR